jgi:transposase
MHIGSQYRQIAARRGPNKATVAIAHSILFAAWYMFSTGQTYDDLGGPRRLLAKPHPGHARLRG